MLQTFIWGYLEVNIEVWDTRKEVKDSLSNYSTVNGLRHASVPVTSKLLHLLFKIEFWLHVKPVELSYNLSTT